MTTHPIIGITMGDPVGIGPEVVLKALSQRSIYDICRPLVLGDIHVLTGINHWLRTGLTIRSLSDPGAGQYQYGSINVTGLSDLDYSCLQPGRPTPETGCAMVKYIRKGVQWAMDGLIHGLATCPINKMAMHKAGFTFDGHTDLLAEQTGTSECTMMLAGSRLRVALVTIHVPLSQVPGRLTTDAVLKTIRITEEGLRNSFGIRRPTLAVAALNPHAGEGGLFGDEEIRIISPALRLAAEDGMKASGPYPPDTLFHRALKGTWDAVICMYHDQGLIPFKMAHFHDGVNTTLGLPIVRTSVDHGTAYDIAGTGRADPGSLVAAIHMAANQARQRAKGKAHGA